MAVGRFLDDVLETWSEERMLVQDHDVRPLTIAYGSNFRSGDGYGRHLGNSRLNLLSDSQGVQDLCIIVVMLESVITPQM